MKERRGSDRRHRFDSPWEPTPVPAVTIEANVKDLLAQLLQAMRSGQTRQHTLGDATITVRFVRNGSRRARGWVLSVEHENAEPDDIDVGDPLTKQDVGWIDQRDGWFVVVGRKVSIVVQLVKALGIAPQQMLVTRVG